MSCSDKAKYCNYGSYLRSRGCDKLVCDVKEELESKIQDINEHMEVHDEYINMFAEIYDGSTNTLDVSYGLFYNDVSINGSLDVSENAVFHGDVSINGTLVVGPSSTIITTNSINVNDKFIIYSNGDANFENKVVIKGDLDVKGTTTTIDTSNTTIKDALIELSRGTTGVPNKDSGIIIERGNSTNVFMGWDESEDKFRFATTSATGLSGDNLDYTATSTLIANIEANTIDVSGTLSANGQLEVSGNASFLSDVSVNGNLDVTGTLSANGGVASGDYSIAMGITTDASGTGSTAMGMATTASGTASTAMGIRTTASGTASTAMGNNTTASGDYSIAMGILTTASGDTSIAMGYETKANGDYSTAMGSTTTANGDYSTAMGGFTVADGSYSTALGYFTQTTGYVSTAMGLGTVASGGFSTAMGRETKANGDYSTAMGYKTIADASYSTAIGKFNDVSDALFVIGNGTSDSSRNDALVVDFSNNTSLLGNVFVNNELEVSGNTLFQSDISVNGELEVSGNTLFQNDVSVNGNLNIVGDVNFDGTIKIGTNSVTISNDFISIHDNFKIQVNQDDPQFVKMDISSIYGLEVSGHTLFQNDVSINSNLYINDDLNVSGDTKFDGSLNMNNHKIFNLAYPTNVNDVANKQYVDDHVDDQVVTINEDISTFDSGIQSLNQITTDNYENALDIVRPTGYRNIFYRRPVNPRPKAPNTKMEIASKVYDIGEGLLLTAIESKVPGGGLLTKNVLQSVGAKDYLLAGMEDEDKLAPLSELALREFSKVGESLDLLSVQISQVSKNYANLSRSVQNQFKDMLRIPRQLSDPYIYFLTFTTVLVDTPNLPLISLTDFPFSNSDTIF